MSEFVVVFRGGEAVGSPEQLQQHMQKWRNWLQDLQQKGHFQTGRPLEKGGKVVKGSRKLVTDGPFAEAKDLVGGFIIVSASSLEEAVELSKGCPGLDFDGVVEVRPVAKLSM